MFKTADGNTYKGPTKIVKGQRNPAWANFESIKRDPIKKLALSFRATTSPGTKLLLVGVGTGNAAFEVVFAHNLALLGFDVTVVCIDPCKTSTYTDGIDGTKTPFIESHYACASDFVSDKKFTADITIMSMIWPNPHFSQVETGTYDIEAVELIKPDYLVTMYSTSRYKISGTIHYSAAMITQPAMYCLSFKGFKSDLSYEFINLYNEVIKLIEITSKDCDALNYRNSIIMQMKSKISRIWYDALLNEIFEYIVLSYISEKCKVLDEMKKKLADYERDIVIDAELKLIKLI
jgi:hypothetical protein